MTSPTEARTAGEKERSVEGTTNCLLVETGQDGIKVSQPDDIPGRTFL